jgi:hypothetical protein
VRAALERSGLDHGPISVFEKMKSMGLEPVPSVASLARIFRQSGVARLQRGRSPGPRIAGSFTLPRTVCGSWMRPSTSSPVAVNA